MVHLSIMQEKEQIYPLDATRPACWHLFLCFVKGSESVNKNILGKESKVKWQRNLVRLLSAAEPTKITTTAVLCKVWEDSPQI